MTITDFRLFLISFLAAFREHMFAFCATIQVKANGSDEIDNKSFYASCEAVSRGLNPLKVPLVVLSEAENTVLLRSLKIKRALSELQIS